MRVLALALCLAPFAASAGESITASLTADGAPASSGPIYIGASNCATKTISFAWQPPSDAVGGETYSLIAARSVSTCANSTTIAAPDKVITTTTQLNAVVNASDLLVETGADGGAGGGCDSAQHPSSQPLNMVFCVQTQVASFTSTVIEYGQFQVSYANMPPTPPTSVVVEPGSKHLRVGWSPGNSSEKIDSYDVHVVLQGQPIGNAAEHVTGSTSVDVQKTDDGKALEDDGPIYDITIIATDVYGNVSDPSAVVEAQPTYVADFYNYYRDNGGNAMGGHGCSTGSTGATWIIGLAAAVALFARRRKKTGIALALLCALGATGAHAAPYKRPSRKALFAFKIDRYDPKIDTEAGLGPDPTPYHTIFGGRAPLRYQLEANWEVAHPFGTFLLGVTAGFWQNYGKGMKKDGTKSADTALLDVIPLGVIATYRFDWLADRYRWFPIIPYGQVGLSRALWASFSGTGDVSTREGGGRGSGWSYGYTTAAGVAVNLDAIDPGLALEAYNDVGIQRTSLFAEYGWTRLDNFHNSGGLILSDRAWRFGLALEF